MAREDDFIAVTISDDGIGIPADQIEHLFEPFHTTKSEGQGLGLFAAKHIIEMHQGTVEIQSTKGSGATVIVKLPVAAPELVFDPMDDLVPEESADSLPVER